ncbi:MAG: sel1 repeat family protein, partial [Alphaproteobacteria bacterium]
YRMAALQGHDYAQFDLGRMFAAGTGVAQDNIEAYKWISLAIAQGNDHMIKHRNRLSAGMNAAEIAQARRLARQWSKGQR